MKKSAKCGGRCCEEASLRVARSCLDDADVYHQLIRGIMDDLVQVFPMTRAVALVLEPAPGLPAVVIPIEGSVPGIVGLPDVTYTSND